MLIKVCGGQTDIIVKELGFAAVPMANSDSLLFNVLNNDKRFFNVTTIIFTKIN